MPGSELIAWLAAKPTMIARVDDLSDLIRRGFIRVDSDRETIAALTTTPTAPVPLTLPSATA
jgi:hypothetical protein